MHFFFKLNRIFFLLSICIFSAHSATQHDLESWFNLTVVGDFNKQNTTENKIKYWLETQERIGDDITHFTQNLIRPGLGYSFNKNFSLWLGYAWVSTGFPLTRKPFKEDRIWEQLLWIKKYNFITLTSRTRMEQRFLENAHTTAYRARQLFKCSIPLKKYPRLSLVLSDELFIHKNNFIGNNFSGFDQNRYFIGFGYPIKQHGVTEIGYLNQWIRRKGVPNFLANVIAINFYLTL